MLHKTVSGLLASGLLLVGQNAMADPPFHHKKHGGRYSDYDYARVTDVDPLIREVRVSVPRRECWTETRYEPRDQRGASRHHGAAGPMILGGLIGAAVGTQIGSGDGRRAATVAGAVIGSAIGHDAAERRNGRYYRARYEEPRGYDVERCEIRYEDEIEERIDGYRVTYVYNGREFRTTLPYDTGERIRVRVNVRPDERY
jgi:uncharacterized protein YcfJ